MFKNPKTTVSGMIVAGAAVASHFYPQHRDIILEVLGIFAAYGLIMSRDHDKSSEDVGLK